MVSPYKYRGVLHYSQKKEDRSKHEIARKLFDHFKHIDPDHIESDQSLVSFYTYSNLFSLEHKVEVEVVEAEESSIVYNFNYGELYKIIFMVLLFALFFVKFSWWIYLVIAFSFSIGIITVNIHYVNSFIKRNIIAAIKQDVNIDEEYISKQQKEWIDNPLKCPACGEEINKYSEKCLNCGIKVQNKKLTTKASSTSKGVDYQYSYKKDEKNRS